MSLRGMWVQRGKGKRAEVLLCSFLRKPYNSQRYRVFLNSRACGGFTLILAVAHCWEPLGITGIQCHMRMWQKLTLRFGIATPHHKKSQQRWGTINSPKKKQRKKRLLLRYMHRKYIHMHEHLILHRTYKYLCWLHFL